MDTIIGYSSTADCRESSLKPVGDLPPFPSPLPLFLYRPLRLQAHHIGTARREAEEEDARLKSRHRFLAQKLRYRYIYMIIAQGGQLKSSETQEEDLWEEEWL